MPESLLLDTERKALSGTPRFEVTAFEITKKTGSGFEGVVSIENREAKERTHIRWMAVYKSEGAWTLINMKTSTTVLHEAKK